MPDVYTTQTGPRPPKAGVLHPEILEDGPPLTATLATYHRDRIADPAFQRPSDHDARGLLAGGTYDTPNAESNALSHHLKDSSDWAMLESPRAARRRQENASAAAKTRWERLRHEGASLAARQRKFLSHLSKA